MTDVTVRRFKMVVRVLGFLLENPIEFPKGSHGPQLVDQLQKAVAELQELSGEHISQITDARASTGRKSEARRSLVETMDAISLSAEGIAVTTPGLEGKFQLIRGASNSVLLSRARSFAVDAEAMRDDFVRFAMAPTFVNDLKARIAALEQAIAEQTASTGSHISTTASIDDKMQAALDILTQLDPVVSNTLAGELARKRRWKWLRRVEPARTYKPSAPAPEVPKPDASPGPAANSLAAAA